VARLFPVASAPENDEGDDQCEGDSGGDGWGHRRGNGFELLFGAGKGLGADFDELGLGLLLVFGDLIDFGEQGIPALGGGFVIEGKGLSLCIPLKFSVVGFVEVEDLEEGFSVEIILGADFCDVRKLRFETGLESFDGLLDLVVRDAFGSEVLSEECGAVGEESQITLVGL